VSAPPAFDAYAVLGVSPLASDEQIHRAYRAVARRLHPDANPGDPRAAAAFADVTAAYELLHDPARRRAYDLQRAARSGPRAARTAPGPTGNTQVRGPGARPAHRPHVEPAPPPSERQVSDTDEFALLRIILIAAGVFIALLLAGIVFLAVTARCDNGLDIGDECRAPTPSVTAPTVTTPT
jgi:curved DNA-binding protein CbpA